MITIVVGAQYGGEGKGKICSYLGGARAFPLVCRTGGVNSSHTVAFDGRVHRLRMIPASAVVQRSQILYGAGSLLDLDVLFSEARELGVSRDQILIDTQAGIIDDGIVTAQRADARYVELGSTLTGTGYASAMRCRRELVLAKDVPELAPNLADVTKVLYDAAMQNRDVLIEGHQGAGLSNYHGDYPYVSSRDCTASSLLSEVGLGLKWETEVILAVKVFPTRNHNGRLPGEIAPEQAMKLGIQESGGGSKGIPDRRRRVGTLCKEDIRRAIMLNTPDCIALTGLDYLFPEVRGICDVSDMPLAARRYIDDFEEAFGIRVGIVSTGPEVDSTIELPVNLLRQRSIGRA